SLTALFMSKPFYITTTLPYVNSDPHVGFALEIIRADIIARYRKLLGDEVFFNTGTDEHGAKIYQNAVAIDKDPQDYVDEYAAKFRELIPLLNISQDVNFIRTTDAHHVAAAQEFWKRCDENGDIYKKAYKIKYCIGCELEKTESELNEDGRCPLHPNRDLEIIEEENYFFKFSKYQQPLLDFYAANPNFVVPDFRYGEIKSFVERGLEDFSISRLKSKMPWGIEVPGDSDQVMYVWFDALVNYVSAVGFPDDQTKFDKWIKETGGMVQYCGKDNLRQQSAMWQAMLMSAKLPNSKQIIIDGFITGEGGIKMSKSIGNVINPVEIVDEYDADALRYYVTRELSPFEDSPFTKDMFKQAYNANLANGIGNLVSRVMKMAVSYEVEYDLTGVEDIKKFDVFSGDFAKYDLKSVADKIWARINDLDGQIQKTEPFKLIKTNPEEAKKIIAELVRGVTEIGYLLTPLLPETSAKILDCVKNKKSPDKPLFLRRD
ncbi:MAG: methionine--tRNA ligase, partial [bacterium]